MWWACEFPECISSGVCVAQAARSHLQLWPALMDSQSLWVEINGAFIYNSLVLKHVTQIYCTLPKSDVCHFSHAFEEILCALHKDNSFKCRVFTHDSTAAISSYNKLLQKGCFQGLFSWVGLKCLIILIFDCCTSALFAPNTCSYIHTLPPKVKKSWVN